MLRWGDGNHTAHTDGHTATLGSLHNVNGGRLYPTLLSFMHLGGKHSSIDSKPWPVIGVGFGVPDFLFFFFNPSFFICALKTQNLKIRPESEGPTQPLGRILRGFGTKPQNSRVLSLSGSQLEAGFPAEQKEAGHGGVRASGQSPGHRVRKARVCVPALPLLAP